MYTHVMVGANDVEASKAFYDAVFETLGYRSGYTDDKGRVFWMTPTGTFGISKPIDGNAACAANGGTIGFAITSPEQGEAWHAAGVAHGGTSIEDPPGWRENAMGKMYLAYLRDPTGNKICVMLRG